MLHAETVGSLLAVALLARAVGGRLVVGHAWSRPRRRCSRSGTTSRRTRSVSGLSLVDAARLFTLVNVSIHDALHTTQTSKFVYGLWRPVTAIRNAADDLNPATDPDATWLSLITTPPYPSYAGNMAGAGAAAATALARALGTNDMHVAATWHQSDGGNITHDFDGFWQAAEEQSMSRIYGGIHYRFDQVAGQQVGRSVARSRVHQLHAPAGGLERLIRSCGTDTAMLPPVSAAIPANRKDTGVPRLTA